MGEKTGQVVVNFISRAIIGLGTAFFLNQFFEYRGIPVAVGMNIISFLTTGILGIPGVGLLYGILFYQLL